MKDWENTSRFPFRIRLWTIADVGCATADGFAGVTGTS